MTKNKKAVFFDLDGTLIPVDLDRMFSTYWDFVRESDLIRLIDNNTEKAIGIFNSAAKEMMSSKGGRPNKLVFFEHIEKMTGRGKDYFEKYFDAFYASVFDSLGSMIEKNDIQRKIVDTVRSKGYRTALATMPVFPVGAAVSRLSWVGLDPNDFEYISHWENSNFMKPHPGYYKEILQRMGLEGKDCIMVGNNVKEDMCARELGFDVFLVTGHEIGDYKKEDFMCGSLDELHHWAQNMPCAEESV
ncbi:MAG: HAD family hydrolase [Eubacteriales bacterium]